MFNYSRAAPTSNTYRAQTMYLHSDGWGLVKVLESRKDNSTYYEMWGKDCSLAASVEVTSSFPCITKT